MFGLQWKTGKECRAPWSKDGKFYDATIVMMHPDNLTCTVKYCEDNSEEIQQLSRLLPSRASARPPGGKFATPRSNRSQANVSFEIRLMFKYILLLLDFTFDV